jgi:hypothetical protein
MTYANISCENLQYFSCVRTWGIFIIIIICSMEKKHMHKINYLLINPYITLHPKLLNVTFNIPNLY